MTLAVTMIGGGMIARDQLLPSLYHLQRTGVIGDLTVCATSTARLRELAEAAELKAAFPGQLFRAMPDLSEPADRVQPRLYQRAVERMKPGGLVVVAVPEALHLEVVTFALEHGQHVLCVKPLALRHADAVAIDTLAKSRNLFVGVEYHKRFDRRSLEARRAYREGKFGQFRLGEARLIEPWYYRNSNFQNWFTKESTDAFTYIGCHYVDLVHFITGLQPVAVSVKGVEGRFPNGTQAWLWASGRVTFEGGGVLNVLSGLGYPDAGPGSNDQGMTLYCEDGRSGAIIAHNDQFRGVQHGYLQSPAAPSAGVAAGEKAFRYVNPDYLRLVPWGNDGLRPVGYGYDSVEASVLCAVKVNSKSESAQKLETLRRIDARGLVATPGNSSFNELVIEAGRRSIASGGAEVSLR